MPDLLKQAWGAPPAVAIFATNARYKREAYRGSEFAPRILADAGLDVIMKSDHPVLDSRYLVYEAAQAHHYGLNWTLAMSSVTTKSAKAMGLDHRIGYVREGYDADIVIWDSFPLTLGATPKQTYIDGIPQIIKPHVVSKSKESQYITPSGEYDEERKEALETRGEPNLRSKKKSGNIIFKGVSTFLQRSDDKRFQTSVGIDGKLTGEGTVVIEDGMVKCVGDCVVNEGIDFDIVDLNGGGIAPGLITVGSFLGLMEIRQEPSTWDGVS